MLKSLTTKGLTYLTGGSLLLAVILAGTAYVYKTKSDSKDQTILLKDEKISNLKKEKKELTIDLNELAALNSNCTDQIEKLEKYASKRKQVVKKYEALKAQAKRTKDVKEFDSINDFIDYANSLSK